MRKTNVSMKAPSRILGLGLGLGMILFGATALAEVVLIANPGSGVSAVSADEAKALFLGKSKKLPNGKEAEAIEQPEGSAVRDVFNDKVLGKTDSQLKAYWSTLIFSGKGTPLKSLDSDAAVKAYVAKTPGGIGYIDSGVVDSSVTVVLTVK